jgi:hypothetical protein
MCLEVSLDKHFLLNDYSSSKFCSTLLETVSLYVPNQNLRHFALFTVDLKHCYCPSASCASAANVT